ncbi:TrbG/VirB9 family P-type conjugative transfer protein [Cetobacterium sp. 2A]|uniref:TrbG/VirB9 family P-type conjugative transfer protein n=1 Tax=Cetobacterium sp. 2A TaxID=2754723 RepID=UPI00163C1D42|nr:TrbG/VirB9 family P-type conjugative transfer protein [Cetobacterium sp. 2A]MBC2857001.1 TrbG/VirB9 family P-type conjugative transfer protein [Cetobacterium sp. 2A]
MKKIIIGLFIAVSSLGFSENIVSLKQEAMKRKFIKVVYKSDVVYEVYGEAMMGTAIVFGDGEEVKNYSLSDPAWSGIINSNQIYLKAPEEEYSSDGARIYPPESTLFVSTTKRNYYFKLKIIKSRAYNPVIKFVYPQEEQQLIQNYELMKREEEKQRIRLGVDNIQNINMNYKWDRKYSWAPTNIIDNGKQTMIFLSVEDKDIPTFYIKRDKELEIGLFRISENRNGQKVITIDQIFEEGVLTLHKKKIKIINKSRR